MNVQQAKNKNGSLFFCQKIKIKKAVSGLVQDSVPNYAYILVESNICEFSFLI